MFLVLLLHSLYYSLGRPTAEDYVNSGVEMVLRTEFEAISLVCVNVFVMISGWFGIKIKIKRLAEFIYQWLFLAVFVVAVLLISGIRFPIGDYKYLIGSYQFYWFIYAYLLLAFSKIKFYSKVVNKVAASAFAVYLLHSNYAVFETYFTKVINIIHTEYSGILYPIITLSFLVAVFILSVLADQLRIYSYAFIAKRAEKKLLNNGRIKNS